MTRRPSALLFSLLVALLSLAAASPRADDQPPADPAAHAAIAVLGDSLADGIWGGLYRKLVRDKRYTIFRGARNSVGFGREPLTDQIDKAFAAGAVDAVVMMVGANDRGGIYGEGKLEAPYRSPQWPDVYRRRVDAFMDAVAAHNVPLVWILLPIMRDDGASADARLINGIVTAAAEGRANVALIETWPITADDKGAYAAYLKDAKGHARLVRFSDGVHFTDYGYELISDVVLARLAVLVPLPQLIASPEIAMTPLIRATAFGLGSLVLGLAGCISMGKTASPSADPLPPGLHRALERLQAGRIERVTVLQIGDSHTAGLFFSGHLRELFQARFGNAGRGMMPAGAPFPYWRPHQVAAQQKGGWEVISSNRSDYASLPYGLSGFITRSRKRDDTMTLQAASDGLFDQAVVDFFRQPAGGHVAVNVDGERIDEIDTSGRTYELARRTIAVRPGSHALELRTRGDGVVDIADWAVYRRERGVVLSSHGFSGAEIGIMGRWDPANVARQLRELDPALIILAFGTNEGFASADRLADYGALFEARLAALRRLAPAASIVVVGPPDADRFPAFCAGARDGAACRPLDATEAADYGQLLQRRDRRLCRWHPPAGLALVRQAQQEAARRQGAAFWDWSTVQGGACGADRWVGEGLEGADRVHMTEAGYRLSAERLFTHLMNGYRGR